MCQQARSRSGGVTARRLLVISHCYPPMPSVGGNRWAAMVRHLRALGHETTVVTTAGFGDIPGETGVVRTNDVMASPAFRRVLRAPALPAVGAPGARQEPPSRFLKGLVVPDSQLASWAPGAYRAARERVRAGEVDCVITSSPPESSHLVALALGRDRPAWVADFRDGWTFEPWRPAPLTAVHKRLDAWLERQVVLRADAISVVANALVEDFRARFGVDATYLPGGWDPALEPDPIRAAGPQVDAARLTLVYTGKLWGPPGRDPSALFEALRRLVAYEPAIRDRVQLVIAGPLDRDQTERLEGFGLGDVLRHLGHLPRADALALQRRADVLVLVTSGNRSNIPGKLWEYLAARRPILALADGNEAAWLVRETRTGLTVPPGDVDAIEAALHRVLNDDLDGIYAPRNVEAYAYPGPAREVSELIERAITRSAARSPAKRP
jgi:glycosyltransferase involved in cell wall biosynthesis